MNITGNIDDVEIPPLLFLSFIENCFKHGLKEVDKIKIDICFEITKDNYLEFKLANNFNSNTHQGQKQGIGIMNSKRRLTLLYDNDFILETNIEEDIYTLFLKIPVL
jgi:LytS/YehU family sensor histidine kinase